MADPRRASAALLAASTLVAAHAVLTWPLRRVLTLFLGGAALVFLAEVAVVRFGLLDHAMAPRVWGVPLAAVAGWPASIYVAVRVVALLGFSPGTTALVAALLATSVNALLDPLGVRAGLWRYPDARVSGLRLWGVPWWNAAGWFVLTLVVASAALA
ncbi:MAG: carotenoid biosynthesis protein [Haloarculaceae archaeon]